MRFRFTCPLNSLSGSLTHDTHTHTHTHTGQTFQNSLSTQPFSEARHRRSVSLIVRWSSCRGAMEQSKQARSWSSLVGRRAAREESAEPSHYSCTEPLPSHGHDPRRLGDAMMPNVAMTTKSGRSCFAVWVGLVPDQWTGSETRSARPQCKQAHNHPLSRALLEKRSAWVLYSHYIKLDE